MAQGILVFIEERDGTVKKASLESLGAARRLADSLQEPVTALVAGQAQPSVDLAQHGADAVILVRSEILASYSAEGYTAVKDTTCRCV